MRHILLALAFVATPVLAADKADPATVKGGPAGTNVEMPFLMAPMNDADGKLSGYAYISTRLTAASAAAALQVRDKLAFIQDAFVRDVNGAAVTSDPGNVDIPGIEARLAADARRVMGAANVKMVTVCTLQIAPLHPKGPIDPSAPGVVPPKSRCEPEKPGG